VEDVLVRIKRAVLAGRYAFSEKARTEMKVDGLTEMDVVESILNAVAIYKTLRSRSPVRTQRKDTSTSSRARTSRAWPFIPRASWFGREVRRYTTFWCPRRRRYKSTARCLKSRPVPPAAAERSSAFGATGPTKQEARAIRSRLSSSTNAPAAGRGFTIERRCGRSKPTVPPSAKKGKKDWPQRAQTEAGRLPVSRSLPPMSYLVTTLEVVSP